MHAWENIQQTIDYLEQHLDEKIDIVELANMASLSPFYYQRLFSRLVKKPVVEYAKLRRMAKAAETLLHHDKRILEIAIDLGFTSHEQFSRTFKTTFGLTPAEYRKNPRTLNRMTKPELVLHYTLLDEGVPLITEGIVLAVHRKEVPEPLDFLGEKIDVPLQALGGLGVESGIDPLGALWETFHGRKPTFQGLFENDEEVGVALPCPREGYMSYFVGGLSPRSEGPDGFDHWELPAGEYIVCSFEAENFEALVTDALYKAQQYLYHHWLPHHHVPTEAFCAERYASHSPDTTRMEIWLKVKDGMGTWATG